MTNEPVGLAPGATHLLSGLLTDALTLAGRGVATPADIDIAMRLGAGHPRGPFEVLAGLTAAERHQLGLPDVVPAVASAAEVPAASVWSGPVGVVGTGHMAGGIVEAIARSGREVKVLARQAASGAGLLERLTASLDRAVSRGRLTPAERGEILGRVTPTVEPPDLAGVDVVVEAVAEDLAVKAAVLARLDAALPGSVPLATNTSSYRVADLRPAIAARRPLLALHFFNPAQVMKLVEVVVPADNEAAEPLRAAAGAWVRDLGKTPVACADTRGFVVNRLLIPYLNDAAREYEKGLPAAKVDELMRTGAGHPMGPLALLDLIGLDVTVAALESMAAVEDDPRIAPATSIRELVAAGHLGRKTGRGFHVYDPS